MHLQWLIIGIVALMVHLLAVMEHVLDIAMVVVVVQPKKELEMVLVMYALLVVVFVMEDALLDVALDVH